MIILKQFLKARLFTVGFHSSDIVGKAKAQQQKTE